jgi:hypothetical protein
MQNRQFLISNRGKAAHSAATDVKTIASAEALWMTGEGK